MDFQNQQLSWSDYYVAASNTSWLDLIASVMYNNRYLTKIIKTKPYSILEVGAARGLHAITLSYVVPKVLGIDTDEHLIEIAAYLNGKFRGKAEFLKMDAFNIGFNKNSFSICCSQGFFEHFSDSDLLALIDEQLRVARIAIFSVPSYYYPRRNVGNERLMKLQDWERIMNRYKVHGFYYGPSVDTSIGLLGVLKQSSIKSMFSKARRAQICLTVRRK